MVLSSQAGIQRLIRSVELENVVKTRVGEIATMLRSGTRPWWRRAWSRLRHGWRVEHEPSIHAVLAPYVEGLELPRRFREGVLDHLVGLYDAPASNVEMTSPLDRLDLIQLSARARPTAQNGAVLPADVDTLFEQTLEEVLRGHCHGEATFL